MAASVAGSMAHARIDRSSFGEPHRLLASPLSPAAGAGPAPGVGPGPRSHRPRPAANFRVTLGNPHCSRWLKVPQATDSPELAWHSEYIYAAL